MLEPTLVQDFVDLGEELFTEFVGDNTNANFAVRTITDPVTGASTETLTPCRAIKLDEEVGADKGEKVYETVIYLLQSEVVSMVKDAEVRFDFTGRVFKVNSWSSDPADVTWRVSVDG